MRTAFVYDRVNKFGGAERVLLALHEIYPNAPLYTAVYDSKGVPWARDFKVIPSFLQKFPFAKTHHELYPWLTPLAFESFSFDSFDVVISVTSAEAKGIITKPSTLHVCYCLTPTRYLWSGYQHYLSHPQYGFFNPLVKLLMKPILSYLQRWDKIASSRVDQYLAISENVKKRIKKYYQQESVVIYPPVDTKKFNPLQATRYKPHADFFLIVSRLVSYKRIDITVKAFNELELPLIIIGDGVERKNLEKIASNNIKFLGQNLTDKEVLSYYQKCRALIFSGDEDLGLVSLEAQACGKPVIAFKGGGIPETIIEGKTGEFFFPQTAEALIKVVSKFDETKYNSKACRNNALRFDKKIFKKRFKESVEKIWRNHRKNL